MFLLSKDEKLEDAEDEVIPMSQCSYLATAVGLKMNGRIPNMNAFQFNNQEIFPSRSLLQRLENLVILNKQW